MKFDVGREILKMSAVNFRYPVLSASSMNAKRHLLSRFRRGMRGSNSFDYQESYSVENFSIDVVKGSRIAIVGKNGAGKSTLLRLAAGHLVPDSGSIQRFSKVLTLLGDRSTGLDPELTGYENCGLILRAHGLGGIELEEAVIKALDLFGFPDRIETVVRSYSTGMQVRLRTAVLLNCPGQLLLFDEILGLADLEFRRRVEPLLNEKILKSEALLLATHSRSVAEAFCSECIWIDDGNLLLRGDVKQVWDAYVSSTTP